MASSARSPSPASDASPPGSPQLTPRSKLRAELAALDESSDDDSAPIDRKALFKSTQNIVDRTKKDIAPKDNAEQSGEDDEDEDDEEDIVRPRGRLAARMQASNGAKQARASNSPETAPEAQDSTLNADSEDEDAATVPRRRRIRTARESTPEPRASREASPASPGLFVTPNKSQHSEADSDSDDDLPANLAQSSRFQALVAQKRKERLAKEAEEKQKLEEKRAQLVQVSDEDDDDVSDISDDDGGRKLTQEVSSRPAVRKASKKALEDMNRETQRLSRSMQLAHEAKTKKKISKASLFERFNFKLPGAAAPASVVPPPSSSRAASPASAHQTDAEMAEKDTPPSSPPTALKETTDGSLPAPSEPQEQQMVMLEEEDEEDLPSLEDVVAEARKLDKGKGIATLADLESPKKKTPVKPKRQVRVKFPAAQANLVMVESDDDELQVAKPKKQSKIDAIFNRVPAQKNKEVQSVHAFRQLAHLSSPPQDTRKRNQKPSMTVGELQLTLQQRARAQAKLERDRRMEMLKAKGVHVQTEEEREKEREQVEDIVTRARLEAEEIMAREREDAKKAKKERKANGEEDHLDWDDSDDDSSFAGSEDEELRPIEQGEIDFSGSEDEEDDENDEDDEGDQDETAGNPMLDAAAEEADESGDEDNATKEITGLDDDDEEGADNVRPTASRSRRNRKNAQVISDDEDEPSVQATPKPRKVLFKSPDGQTSESPMAPKSVLRSATKTFIPGLPVPAAGPAGLGLTQIFAGTMDDSQAGSMPQSAGSPLEFRPTFENFPDSQFSATAGESQPADGMIMDSQTETQGAETQTQGVQLHFEQSQMHGFDSLMQQDNTQISDMLEPTQDAGFGDYTPLKNRFVDPPQGTVDTVILNGTPRTDADADAVVMDSPLAQRRGKLRRRGQAPLSESTLPPTEVPASPSADVTGQSLATEAPSPSKDSSAFRLMAKAASRKKRAQEKFDKKKSKAREMVHGEAEESEDEYAGLGGADGEDSSDEEDDELRQEMIDDESKGLTEEEKGKMAAFYADRERAADSAQVDKLFKDITTGMLRKRRRGGGGGNNDFDLSDSDDGGEARRRMKRKQFAKMQKALFADERIGKIAENPRNAAFMKSIEDWGSDEDMGFDEPYFEPEEESQNTGETQARQDGEDSIPDSQPTGAAAPDANVGRKRTRNEPSEPGMRPPPNLRRVRDGAKPSSLADVRRSLSSMLGEPNMSSDSIIPATDPNGSDSEGEQEEASEDSRRTNKENRQPGYVAVVDRISLKRSGSSNVSASSKLAFAAPASSSGSGTFKVPALLRRATTNSLMSQTSNSSTSSTGVTTGTGASGMAAMATGAFGEEGKLKKTAGKRSGVNFFARENERREKLKESERRREEKKWKGVEGRSKAVGGLFGGGQFE